MTRKKYDPGNILLLVEELAYLEGECNCAPDLKEGKGVPVKGRYGVLSRLKAYLKLLEGFPNQNDEICSVEENMKNWINHFTSEYKPEGKYCLSSRIIWIIMMLKSYPESTRLDRGCN